MVATQHRTRTLNRLAIAGRVVGNQPQPKSHIRPNLSQFGNDKSLKYTQNHLHRVGKFAQCTREMPNIVLPIIILIIH